VTGTLGLLQSQQTAASLEHGLLKNDRKNALTLLDALRVQQAKFHLELGRIADLTRIRPVVRVMPEKIQPILNQLEPL